MSFDIDDDNSDDYTLPPYGQFAPTAPVLPEASFKVVMGRPVVMNALEEKVRKESGIDLSDPYDESIKKNCKKCLREVWLGPRIQAAMAQDAELVPMCPTCAVETLHDVGGTMDEVINLGGVHERGN